ncbi:hypothetical protein [Thiobaca trueperi]|uniref:hypothetical protein n=1 Tax=Thiobaca trueperi TaxID=127458 RepID=UPI001FB29D27|nr:hypothetical protein [Thiobaca trueperi]
MRHESGIEPGSEPVKQRAGKKSPSANGSRLTLSTLPVEWDTWARTERPDLDPQRTWALFADYWTAKPGASGCKADWFATWRNWVRREQGQASRTNRTGGQRHAAASEFVAKDYTRGATRPEDLPDWARDYAGSG